MPHAATHDASPVRRMVIAGTTLALASAAVPTIASAASRTPSVTGPVARTTAGQVAGERAGRTVVLRGAPYAQAPTGTLRFSSPRPPRPWRGIRDATRFAPPSHQSVVPGSSEDSLYANTWTPDPRGSRPVMVYIHGGGWFVGTANHPLYDGQRPADRGDMVVVTFNYRLGAFGWGLRESLTDPATGAFAHCGLQDQAALLHRIRANAEAFGGNPDNTTVCGTSADGSSAWQLSLLPEIRTVIRRIAVISAAHAWTPAVDLTAADATEAYERIAHRLGTTVSGPRHAEAAAIKDTWETLFSGPPRERVLGSGRGVPGTGDRRPLDARLRPRAPHPQGARALRPHPYRRVLLPRPRGAHSAPRAHQRNRAADRCARCPAQGAPEVSDTLVERCPNDYREAAADGLPDGPRTLWTEIRGDGLFRRTVVRFAERHARTGTSPLCVMDFGHPVHPPHFGTSHEATSRFLFGTHPLPEEVPVHGDGPLGRQISDAFIDLVFSFARGQAPAAQGVDSWPVLAPGRPSSPVLGGPDVARIGDIPEVRQLRLWDEAGWGPRI
ncbi:carboxylesterase family protein [Streptomyces sp. NPDC004051]